MEDMDCNNLDDDGIRNPLTAVSEEGEEITTDDVDTNNYQMLDIEPAYNFKCETCTDLKIFSSKKDYDTHMCLEHNETLKSLGLLKKRSKTKCDICGLEVEEFSLKDHIRVVHKGEMAYKCDYCKEDFPYKISLTTHIKYAHKVKYLEKEKNILILECTHCPQIFRTLLALRAHMAKRHDPDPMNPRRKPFPCDKCDRVFYRSDHLKLHINTVHLKMTPFKCDVCKKSFAEQNRLNSHYKSAHKDSEDIECDVCQKVFKGKYNIKALKLHKMEDHSDAPAFECILCNDKFFKKSELLKHGKVHDEEAKQMSSTEITQSINTE